MIPNRSAEYTRKLHSLDYPIGREACEDTAAAASTCTRSIERHGQHADGVADFTVFLCLLHRCVFVVWCSTVGTIKDPAPERPKLDLYTTWFSTFESVASVSRESIELPGQYTGQCRPQPELHVRIVTFDPVIWVMNSLRRPKRITIHGSDEKSHHYLVKGGEDLRMDQRVEQVFVAMNDVLRADPATSRRGLCLRTYQVAPFTSSLGMLEWVNNTQPLKLLLLPEKSDLVALERQAVSAYNDCLHGAMPAKERAQISPQNAKVYYNYLSVRQTPHTASLCSKQAAEKAVSHASSSCVCFFAFCAACGSQAMCGALHARTKHVAEQSDRTRHQSSVQHSRGVHAVPLGFRAQLLCALHVHLHSRTGRSSFGEFPH